MSNQGTKFDGGKPPVELLDSHALKEVAKVLAFGAEKYDRNNWRKGMAWSRVYGAAMRHMLTWNDGETLDQESGLNHIAHAMCNLMFLLSYTRDYPKGDDRWQVIGGSNQDGLKAVAPTVEAQYLEDTSTIQDDKSV